MENGQAYLKNLVEFPTQDFYSIFGHFSTLSMKGLKWNLQSVEIYKPTRRSGTNIEQISFIKYWFKYIKSTKDWHMQLIRCTSTFEVTFDSK